MWRSAVVVLGAGGWLGAGLAGAIAAPTTGSGVVGDLTGDGLVGVTDVQCSLLSGLAALSGAASPSCLAGPLEAADTTCDEAVDVSDALVVVTIALEIGLPPAIDANANGCPDACEESVGGIDSIRSFFFGHSLIWHFVTNNPPPGDQGAVPYWLAQFAGHEGYEYTADGQWGFMSQHANLPPIPQWGFAEVPSSWPEEIAFADADFNAVILAEANFVQYQPPALPYEGFNPTGWSPITATAAVLDWVREQEPGATMYLYEGWPDSAGFGAYPPNPSQVDAYWDYTATDFHSWFLEYQELLLAESPDVQVRMIPVGSIFAELLTTAPLGDIPFDVLFEDDAPHGYPTIYFLASLITYSALYATPPPLDYPVPELIHPAVQAAYPELAIEIWSRLVNFTDDEGNSLVW